MKRFLLVTHILLLVAHCASAQQDGFELQELFYNYHGAILRIPEKTKAMLAAKYICRVENGELGKGAQIMTFEAEKSKDGYVLNKQHYVDRNDHFVFLFDKDRKLLEYTQLKKDGNAEAKVTYCYTDSLLTYKCWFEQDSMTVDGNVYKYRDSKLLVRYHAQWHDAYAPKTSYYYDENGYVEKVVQSPGMRETTFSYNDHGDVSEYTYIGKYPDQSEPFYYKYSYEYLYDSEGNWISMVLYKIGKENIKEPLTYTERTIIYE